MDNAVGGNKIHWLMVNCKNNKSGDTLFSYIGPSPPKGSDKHHYFFLLLQQKNPVKLVKLDNRFMSIQDLFQILQLQKATLQDRKYFLSSFKN